VKSGDSVDGGAGLGPPLRRWIPRAHAALRAALPRRARRMPPEPSLDRHALATTTSKPLPVPPRVDADPQMAPARAAALEPPDDFKARNGLRDVR